MISGTIGTAEQTTWPLECADPYPGEVLDMFAWHFATAGNEVGAIVHQHLLPVLQRTHFAHRYQMAQEVFAEGHTATLFRAACLASVLRALREGGEDIARFVPLLDAPTEVLVSWAASYRGMGTLEVAIRASLPGVPEGKVSAVLELADRHGLLGEAASRVLH